MTWTKQAYFSLNFNRNLAWKTIFLQTRLVWCHFTLMSCWYFYFLIVVGGGGKDHNLFFPHSLATSSFSQLHMLLTWTIPTGFSQINVVLNPLGLNVFYSCGLFVGSVWAAPSKNVGSWTMVCNFFMLCGISEIKTQPNRSQERIFKMRKRRIPPTFLPNNVPSSFLIILGFIFGTTQRGKYTVSCSFIYGFSKWERQGKIKGAREKEREWGRRVTGI